MFPDVHFTALVDGAGGLSGTEMFPVQGCLLLLNTEEVSETQEKPYLHNEATSPYNPDEGHWIK